jgi:hypothetical protein
MRQRVRELYPQQVNLRSNRPDPTFNRLDWVQVYQPISSGKEISYLLRRGAGKLIVNENAHSVQAARTTPNKIEAKTDNVQTMRFYFNEEMVNFDKPVTVVVNGKTRFEGMLVQSVDEMLKDQLFLGRGWRYFTAVLDVDLAPTPVATTQATTRALATTNATQLFFTTDDGKTWFADEASKKAPFLHDEKPAVRAHVFSCDGGKKLFAGYLSKFSPIVNESMVKRSGETAWTPVSATTAVKIMDVKCPENWVGKPVEVFPK